MKNVVARFVTRGTDGDTGTVDLLIGSGFRGSGVLKPNTVYSIKDFMGTLLVVEEGESFLNKRDWCYGYQDLVSVQGNHMWLTKEELELVLKHRENGNG